MKRRLFTLKVFAVAAVLAACGCPGTAVDARAAEPDLKIELNKTENHDNGCRFFFVVDNRSAASFESLKLDLVMFGADGVIAKRIAAEMAPLRPKKTVVKLFDVGGIACKGVGAVLISDVLACRADGKDRTDCTDNLAVASRASATLRK